MKSAFQASDSVCDCGYCLRDGIGPYEVDRRLGRMLARIPRGEQMRPGRQTISIAFSERPESAPQWRRALRGGGAK